MSRQIAVRLPDDLVSFVDQAVSEGRASSRADLVSRALERERRRIIAERDIEALHRTADVSDDLDDLADYVAKTPLDHLD
jgi:Arc/MetJ-type ribon-helix-helix transcriptional regulator